MARHNVRGTVSVRSLEGRPVIEARLWPLGERSPIPRGKVLVRRMPILPPGASDAEIRAATTTRLFDDGEYRSDRPGDPSWLESLGECGDLIGRRAGASLAWSIGYPRRDKPMQPLYDPEAVRPMWEELAKCGVDPVQSAPEVDDAMKSSGTTLVIVNSVCGCAAGSARPGVTRALQHATIPDHLKTVFAGVDREATERAREYMKGIPPSSPSIALFKDGELVHMLERRHIEMMNEEMVAQNLVEAFDEHCGRKGPSVPRDVYEGVVSTRQCGSSVPLFNPFVNR